MYADLSMWRFSALAIDETRQDPDIFPHNSVNACAGPSVGTKWTCELSIATRTSSINTATWPRILCQSIANHGLSVPT